MRTTIAAGSRWERGLNVWLTVGVLRPWQAGFLLILPGIVLLCALFAVSPPAAHGAISLQSLGTFEGPRDVRISPGKPDRIYVAERKGRIIARENGVNTTVLDISSLAHQTGPYEEGLLSFALAPDFDVSGRLYVFFSTPNATSNPAARDNHLQIEEYTVVGSTASLATRRVLLSIPHPIYSSHNGGQINFGPDGYLYIALGDGGMEESFTGVGDPQQNSQNLTTLLGSLLRIDPTPSGDSPYTIPPDNPFAGTANDPQVGARDEIWAFGFRNPWRFSFDKLTGAFTEGDVGHFTYEEINYRDGSSTGGKPARGDNFGWSCREALHAYATPHPLCSATQGTWVDPVLELPHASPTSFSAVVGGFVIRDSSLTGLYGRYIYSDWQTRQIRTFLPSQSGATGDRLEFTPTSTQSVISFGEDHCGRLYLVTDNVTAPGAPTGTVHRIIDGAAAACAPAVDPDPEPIELHAHHSLAPYEPDGDHGWYRTGPTMMLGVSEEELAEDAEITYRTSTNPTWTAYSDAVDMATLGDGEHSVEYKASLTTGEESEVGTITYKRDATAPDTSATSPAVYLSPNDCVALGPCGQEVDLSATDGASGVAHIYAAVTPAGQPAPAELEQYAGSSATISLDEPGEWAVHYFAVDNAGNVEDIDSVERTVFVRDPVVAQVTRLKPRKLAGNQTALVRVDCPAISFQACRVKVAKRLKLQVPGNLNKTQNKARKKGLGVKVSPKTALAGGTSTISLKATKSQCRALAGKKLKGKLKLQVVGETTTAVTVQVNVRCAG